MKKLTLSLFACPLLLVSCTQAPAGYELYGVSKGAGSNGIHTVLPGDTVYTIAQNYQLPMREIITLNGIEAPYVLNAGYRVKLPPPNEHQVRDGDTIFTISKMYEVSPNRLADLNNLKPPYRLQGGQLLRLPTPTLKQEAVARENLARQARQMPTEETARVASVQREALDAPVETSAELPMPTARKNIEKAAVTPPKKPVTTSSPSVKKASTVTRTKVPSDTPRLSGQGKYMRPVSGKVISSYGPKTDGLHNDGINIKAGRGTPVRAAENGVVVYAGNELAGYGNLILVRHQGKMMTAYAHLDKILVERGATIERGQSIGTVGSTGSVDTPQLHFEVRKGSTPINPDKYL